MSHHHGIRELPFVVVLLAAGYLVLPPLGFMLWASLTPGGRFGLGGAPSWSAYAELLQSPQLGRLLGSTLAFALGSTILGVACGTLMAWLVERTNCAVRGLSYAAAFVGFAVPGILRVIGWILLVNPRNGVLTRQLTDYPLVRGIDLESMAGMIFIEGFFWAPLAFLLMVGPLRSLDASLEEAAALGGASPLRTARSITARLLLPSLLSVTILSFIRVVQAFEVPLLLGVPAGVRVLTTEIYEGLQQAARPDYAQASATGVLLLVPLLGALVLYSWVTREASRFQTLSGKGFRPRRLDLKGWKFVGAAFLLVVFLIEALPVAGVLVVSALPTLGAGITWTSWTLRNYRQLVAFPGVALSVIDSLAIALASATAAVLLAAGAAWVLVRSRLRHRWLVEWVLGLPLVFPGIVMSLAVLIFYLRFPLPIYGTIWILILAYIPTFTPFAMRYLAPALLQIHRELEESAYVSGARPSMMFRKILAPLLMPALAGSWIFIFMVSVRELSVAALLYTSHSPVVATQVLDMWTNGNVNQLGAFGTVVAAVSVLVALLAHRSTRSFGLQV